MTDRIKLRLNKNENYKPDKLNRYLDSIEGTVLDNISGFFGCSEADITNIEVIPIGLTNTSLAFDFNGKRYVYRHPGEGTEVIINRTNEKGNLTLAKALDIDPTFVYMDENEGWKISEYVESFREPDYENFEDSKKVIETLKKLHCATEWPNFIFDPWEEAGIIKRNLSARGLWDEEYDSLEKSIGRLVKTVEKDGVKKCFCHCDTYRHNWMLTEDRVILIDWEYAGVSDPGVDIGYYISDAMYDFDEAERFIKEYAGDGYNEKIRYHYMAYTAIISYYWFVWALYRESCGADIGESLDNWKFMAEKYSTF